MRQPDTLQHPARRHLGLRLGDLFHHHLRKHDIAAGRQMRKEVELLEDHADLQPQCLQMQLIVQQLRTCHLDRAGADRLQSVDAAKQRRFSRAAFADDGDHLAGFDIQIYALQHLIVAKALVDFSDFDERH